MSCHGNKSFYNRSCVSCRTINVPSVNGLRCKLAKIALFIQLFQITLSDQSKKLKDKTARLCGMFF